jgi:hypothetical protein
MPAFAIISELVSCIGVLAACLYPIGDGSGGGMNETSAKQTTDCSRVARRQRVGHANVSSLDEQKSGEPLHPEDADEILYPQKNRGPNWTLPTARFQRMSADGDDFRDYNVDGFQTHLRTSMACDFGAARGHAEPGVPGAADLNPATYTPRYAPNQL